MKQGHAILESRAHSHEFVGLAFESSATPFHYRLLKLKKNFGKNSMSLDSKYTPLHGEVDGFQSDTILEEYFICWWNVSYTRGIIY